MNPLVGRDSPEFQEVEDVMESVSYMNLTERNDSVPSRGTSHNWITHYMTLYLVNN